MACLLLQACAPSADDQRLAGRWVEWASPYGSDEALTLGPDHRFTSNVWPLRLSCRRRAQVNDWSVNGRWKFDRDALRLELDYDAPVHETCTLPELHSLVVDPSEGQTDLYIDASDGDPYRRVRLMRPRPHLTQSAASLADNQVECFRAHGAWGRPCLEPKAVCYRKFRDAGKACTDSSQCEGLCLVDMVVVCETGKECQDPEWPKPGQPFVGICQRTDQYCGSFTEIHKGRADPPWHVD